MLQISLFIFMAHSIQWIKKPFLVIIPLTLPKTAVIGNKKLNPDNSVTYNSSFYGKWKYQFVSCLSQHSTLLFLLTSFSVHMFNSFSKSIVKNLLAAFWSSSVSPWPVSTLSCHLIPPRLSLWWVVLYCLFTVLWLALFTKPQY